jgi:hypothetical protein
MTSTLTYRVKFQTKPSTFGVEIDEENHCTIQADFGDIRRQIHAPLWPISKIFYRKSVGIAFHENGWHISFGNNFCLLKSQLIPNTWKTLIQFITNLILTHSHKRLFFSNFSMNIIIT